MKAIAVVVSAALVCVAPAVRAADYPTKPITLMIGFAPGGPSDVMARILTRKMEEILKQPLVIENRAGAGGGIAGTAVARATPDGYTVLLATGSLLAINVSLYKNLGYDPEKDFEPITMLGTQTNVLYTHPSVPAKTLAELSTMPGPIPANSHSAPAATAPQPISQASCSRWKPGSR
jgi:tripartite-type tricarboxylate transporter receptor subunit TctC